MMGVRSHTSLKSFQAFNANDLDRMVALVAPGCVYVNDPVNSTVRGPDGVRQALETTVVSAGSGIFSEMPRRE